MCFTQGHTACELDLSFCSSQGELAASLIASRLWEFESIILLSRFMNIFPTQQKVGIHRCLLSLHGNDTTLCFSLRTITGTPINRIPIMAKQILDLYMLYKLVTEKGGLVEIINKKIWREITKGLNLPTSITSAAFTLRTQ